MRLKRILTKGERVVLTTAEVVASSIGAEAFPKLRVADVIEIEKSGISDDLYSYALRAHFDVVICRDNYPIMAVEFDGAGHDSRNDAKKAELCERFELPLVRVGMKHVDAVNFEDNTLSFSLSVEDLPTAQLEHKNLADFWRRRGQETIKTYGISILVTEGRYEEALNALQLLDRKKLGPKGVPVVENQIAWCETQLGKPAEAIQIAQTSLPQLESMGPAYSSSAHLVLGAANLAVGNAPQAVAHLEKAYATSTDSPARKTTAAFYLGEALSAIGKTAEARAAYQHAHEALPGGKFGVRALERLT